MANIVLVLLSIVALVSFAAEPSKVPPKDPRASSAKSTATTQAPLQNSKAKKKKLLRPGVEWEPAPAPLKW